MPIIILLGTLLLVVGYLLSRWLRTATKAQIKKVLGVALGIFALIALIILILSGRFYHAIGGVVVLAVILYLLKGRPSK
jgi:Uncharacterised BCR, YnfA/UPF0060 family.